MLKCSQKCTFSFLLYAHVCITNMVEFQKVMHAKLRVTYNFECRALYNLPWRASVSSHDSSVWVWVYLAIVKNFKDEKETIAIAKTPGHRKSRKVIESLPLDWSIKMRSKPNLHRIVKPMWERAARWSTQLRRECWVATGLSWWNRCSDPQGSGCGKESLNPAEMKLYPVCHNPFASGKLYKCLQRL